MRMMSVKGIRPFFSLRAAGPFHPRAFSTSAPILYSNSARIAVSYSSHLQKRSQRLHPTWKLDKQHAHFTAPRKPLNKLAVDGGEAIESSCQLTWQILGANPTEHYPKESKETWHHFYSHHRMLYKIWWHLPWIRSCQHRRWDSLLGLQLHQMTCRVIKLWHFRQFSSQTESNWHEAHWVPGVINRPERTSQAIKPSDTLHSSGSWHHLEFYALQFLWIHKPTCLPNRSQWPFWPIICKRKLDLQDFAKGRIWSEIVCWDWIAIVAPTTGS